MGHRVWLVLFALLCIMPSVTHGADQPNVLMITVDDMNWDSVGAFGCPLKGITPNIDQLAAEGMRFEHAHVTIAICQPTRSVWMTGRYPHRNGALGFDPINREVPTLQESLRDAGYFNGILSKIEHLEPKEKFCWDFEGAMNDLGRGRVPEKYFELTKNFLAAADQAEKPFFLMANSNDPHRPFAGSAQEQGRRGKKNKKQARAPAYPESEPFCSPDEAIVPGFLPDLPDIRQELSEYFTSVHRADAITGAVLKALDESGHRDNTLVVFMSDHGMPLPFAKTNCYLNSTKTPLIVRWPGRISAGAVDDQHLVSGIDFMPTVLDALQLTLPPGMDGRSYLPILRGESQKDRDWVFTSINTLSSKKPFPMRAITTRTHGYIFNAWADGETVFKNESQNGLTFKAMQQAAQNDPEIAERVKLFQYRQPEELYNYEQDPAAREDLSEDNGKREILVDLRNQLETIMAETDDPQLENYRSYLKSVAE